MQNQKTPIGGTHARDWQPLREQAPLSALKPDDAGFVHFECVACPRTDKIALADLRARFAPDAGLVNILNAIRPTDCPHAGFDAVGHNRCGIYYRDRAAPSR